MLKRVVVLVSGGGTNLQALIDAQQRGELKNGFLACVISSNPDAYALERARQAGISTKVVSRKSYASREAYDETLLAALKEAQADLIVLAGFLLVLGEKVVKAYDRRMINVHPSLIPSFCGDGYYGLRVHEAALEYGVKVTGATVHFVNEVTDGGQIILQKAVDIHEDDTPESLQKRVMEEAEWVILPKSLNLIANGRVTVADGQVRIAE